MRIVTIRDMLTNSNKPQNSGSNCNITMVTLPFKYVICYQQCTNMAALLIHS
jgi:hypothetical protein